MPTPTRADWLQETPDGVSLAIRVIPRAGVTTIAGVRDGRLLVRVAAAPVEGAANDALLSLLAGILKTPQRRMTIAAGSHGRNKLIAIVGMTAAQAAGLISLPEERA
jgi:uncharacterized protein YggU (UPF0235/DUF167 family)